MIAALLAAPRLRSGAPLPMQIRFAADVSGCETYRWTLTRRWDDGLLLPWIMLNPSTADARADDPTLQRITGFTWRWGFAGLFVINLWPFRSPQPVVLREWLRWDRRQDWSARDAIWANHDRIADELAGCDAAMAAWGCPIGRLGFEIDLAAEALLDKINGRGDRDSILKLFCLGTSLGGSPKHPMARGVHRVPDDAVPVALPRYPGTIVGIERVRVPA